MKRSPESTSRDRLGWPIILIGFAWLFGFAIWFQSFGMPNNQDVQRWMFWEHLPFDLLDLIEPPVKAGAAPWSWLFLVQRLPFLLIAIAIWASAWGIGSLILRALGIPLRGSEQLFFSVTLGLSSISLIVLALGLSGFMSRWPLVLILSSGFLAEIICRRSQTKSLKTTPSRIVQSKIRLPEMSRFGWIVIIGLAPFVLGELIGSMTPQIDFDVVAYHLEGPKEWFQKGQIVRLPHNVYTSFPFLTEMLILSGMVVFGDWHWGALAGQAVIGGFAPLTAVGLYAAGKRWFSEQSGWLAAVVYLTSPWTYRITIIAYAEGGLSCYVLAAVFAALLLCNPPDAISANQLKQSFSISLLTGLLSGSAMACKYTGLTAVVIPVGLILVWLMFRLSEKSRFQSAILAGVVYSLGVGVSVGPWLVKNVVETGNPVYPLAVRVFGGTDRDEAIDEKFRNGHKNTYENWIAGLRDLPAKVTDVMANNDWHSPLMFGLAPLSLLIYLRRKNSVGKLPEAAIQKPIVAALWFYVLWQFFVWWGFTHHIDRFYVPMFSVVALLAGIGAKWCEPFKTDSLLEPSYTFWNYGLGLVVVASTLYNANLMQTGICGFNAGRLDLKYACDEISTPRRIKYLNDQIETGRFPTHTRVLYVGDVQVFHARYPYLYNSVFDHSIFERLCRTPNLPDYQLRPVSEIRAEFQRLGITHIDVCWDWIITYRQPGNYGFTDFVTPQRFVELQQAGILGLPLNFPVVPLSEERRKQISDLKWDQDLFTAYEGKPGYFSAQIFPVIDSP